MFVYRTGSELEVDFQASHQPAGGSINFPINFSVLAEERHSHRMMPPPPCLNLGMTAAL